LRRMTTKIPGLDLVLGGGLEQGSVVILAGTPGAGKTILGQQICFANATAEHKSIYYSTVSEPHKKLISHLEQFSFFDLATLGRKVEHIHLGGFLQRPSRGSLEPLIEEIVRKVLDEEPAVVAIDSVKMLRDFADELELRSALYDLTSSLAHTNTVLLLLGEYTPEEIRTGTEFALADGIIQLEYEAREPVDRRWLRVAKMRGGRHLAGKHTFQIDSTGVRVFPRIETLIPAEVGSPTERISSGIPGLDALMSGGMMRGDATLLFGPSGVGKTIFGLRWASEGLEQGKRCLFVTFQDSSDQLAAMGRSFGWDIEGAHATGQLVISHVPVGDLDLDILANGIRVHLDEGPIDRIVIDSLAELVFAARESERFPAYKRSLVGLIHAAGSSLLVTSETNSHGVTVHSLGGLMFLFDNVLELRYREQGSQVGRALNVVKMRNSAHATTLNSVTITDDGVTVGGALDGVTGLLGWSALRTPEPPRHASSAVSAPA
jgi:circadian clock protein KaiC